MKSLKKIFALILCLTMLFTLGACGNSDGNNSETDAGLLDFDTEVGDGVTVDKDNGNTSGNNSNSGTTGGSGNASKVEFNSNDPFANIPSRLKGSTVTFACWGDEGHSKYQPMIKAFTKKTGIKVKMQTVEQKTYATNIQQKIVAGKGPDIIIDCHALTPISVMQPIDQYIDVNDDFWDDDTMRFSTVNGRVYEVNSTKSTWKNYDYIIYNKSLFTKNNVKSPGDYYKAGQWTWENCYKAMSDITNTGNRGGWIVPHWVAASFGTPIISYDKNTNKLVNNVTSEDVTKAVQWGISLYDANIWAEAMWFSQFKNGNVGLFSGGLYYSKFNGEFSSMDGSLLSAVPYPSSYQGKKTYQVVANHRGYGIAKNAANPEGAAYFLRWFLDYQNYKDAGVKVFMSTELENVYFNTIVPLALKEGVNYQFYPAACKIIGVDENNYIKGAKGGTSQVATLLNSKKNELDGGVKELNDMLANIK